MAERSQQRTRVWLKQSHHKKNIYFLLTIEKTKITKKAERGLLKKGIVQLKNWGTLVHIKWMFPFEKSFYYPPDFSKKNPGIARKLSIFNHRLSSCLKIASNFWLNIVCSRQKDPTLKKLTTLENMLPRCDRLERIVSVDRFWSELENLDSEIWSVAVRVEPDDPGRAQKFALLKINWR